MPVETLTGFPSQFVAGTTVRFLVSFDNYLASAWSLSVSLLGAGAFSAAGDASGDAFLVTFTAAQTATLTPGQYRWAARVTETASGDVAIADDGFVTVTADLSNTATGPWRMRFNAAATAFAGLSAGKYSSIEVEGQSFTMRDASQQIDMLNYLEDKAIAEDKALGRSANGTLKRIQMRF